MRSIVQSHDEQEREPALTINFHVVAKNDVTSALNPVALLLAADIQTK